MTHRVVVTGVGPISVAGCGTEETAKYFETFKNQRPAKESFIIEDELIDESYRFKPRDLDLQQLGIDASLLDWVREWKGSADDMDLNYLAACTQLAIVDSGIAYDKINNSVGLVITHENPGLERFFHTTVLDAIRRTKRLGHAGKTSDIIRNVYQENERMGYDSQVFMYIFHLCKLFSLHGHTMFTNNACASGLYAIDIASDLIRSGKCESVIVAGADSQMYAYKHIWLKQLGLYSNDGVIKPYSINRSGFILGEGGGAVVLEKYESAINRNARIYAEYRGGGFNMEAGRVSLPTVEEPYYEKCIKACLDSAKIDTKNISLVVPHGIGTSITDLHEARSISKVFDKNDKYKVLTLKPYLGHNLGSCALLELCIILKFMENSIVPPSINSDPIDERICLPIQTVGGSMQIEHILKTACGFAGFNAACVFSRVH